MRRLLLIILILFVILLSIGLFSSCLVFLVSNPDLIKKHGDIAVVTFEGEIYNPRPLIKQLESLGKREDIKAVVLRVDSPGGTVSASEEIHRAILRLKEKKKVVASMGTVAASGGYYVACAAEKILANRGTITGSIGVRLNHINMQGLLDWVRIEPRILTSGRYKDLASPFRPIGPEEEEILLSVLKEMHEQFKNVVRRARGFNEDQIAQVADGRIFTGEKALNLGLVDQLGSLQDAIDVAAKMAEIEGEPDVVYPKRESSHWIRYLIDEAVRGMIQALTDIRQESLALWRL